MQIQQLQHELYNDPRRWGSPGIWDAPSFNAAKFQRRMDRIVGTSDGKPIVRLVWAWDHRTKDFYFCDWDSFGRGVKAEFRYKYRFTTLDLGNGDTMDIPPPRWVLEQRYEPGQYAPSWEAGRWMTKTVGAVEKKIGKDENGQDIVKTIDIQKRFELRPQSPPDGWYGFLRCISDHDHDEGCCTRARQRGGTCWGYYREPSQFDLDLVEDAVRRRDADPHKWSPHQPLPPEALVELERGAFEEAAKIDKQDKSRNESIVLDAVARGPYFDYGRKQNGLYLP